MAFTYSRLNSEDAPHKIQRLGPKLIIIMCAIWLGYIVFMLLYVRTHSGAVIPAESYDEILQQQRQNMEMLPKTSPSFMDAARIVAALAENNKPRWFDEEPPPEPKRPKPKARVILQWSRYFGTTMYFQETRNGSEMLKNCPVLNCLFTTSVKDFDHADVVLFHAPDINDLKVYPENLQLKRRPEQLYIFEDMESPALYPIQREFPSQFFNLTMTYRLDSNFPITYYRNDFPSEADANDTNYYKAKAEKQAENLIAMFVSNQCHGNISDRVPYALELQRILGNNIVHIFGACTNNTDCPRSNMTACSTMLDQYYFYLAFENSMCDGYVTEKLYRGLKNRVIPIVNNHRADYDQHAPNGSYIHTKDFASPQKLAEFLLQVAHNETLYNSFLEWRKHPETWQNLPVVKNNVWAAPSAHGTLCSLCTSLNNPEWWKSKIKPVDDIRAWWMNGTCDRIGQVQHMAASAWPAGMEPPKPGRRRASPHLGHAAVLGVTLSPGGI